MNQNTEPTLKSSGLSGTSQLKTTRTPSPSPLIRFSGSVVVYVCNPDRDPGFNQAAHKIDYRPREIHSRGSDLDRHCEHSCDVSHHEVEGRFGSRNQCEERIYCRYSRVREIIKLPRLFLTITVLQPTCTFFLLFCQPFRRKSIYSVISISIRL